MAGPNFLDKSEDTLNNDGGLDAIFKKYNIPAKLQPVIAYAIQQIDDVLHTELERIFIYGGGTLGEVLTGEEAARMASEILVAIHPLPVKPSTLMAVKGNPASNN